MTILDRGIPDQYDFALDGVGYLIAWETPEQAYQKSGQDLQVERQDLSNDMSENKIDGLYWSSQRSFFAGQGQKRLDVPRVSNDERFYQGKNIDTFRERGRLVLSHQIAQQHAAAGAFSNDVGLCEATVYGPDDSHRLYWISSNAAADSTELRLRSTITGATTSRSFDANWTAGMKATGMATDGFYLYVSSTGGVWRGDLSSGSALARVSTTAVRGLTFVKSRLMGWNIVANALTIYEIPVTTGIPSVLFTYDIGWAGVTNHHQFAEIGGFIAWVANNGPNGYLWLWDGVTDPFKAARWEGMKATGIISYSESLFYLLVDIPADAPYPARWGIIKCEVAGSGQVEWDVLHIVDGTADTGTFAIDKTEIFFPVRIQSTEITGITSDAGVSGGIAYAIASINVKNDGLNLGRFWGETSGGAITGLLWNNTGYVSPALTLFRGELVLTGERGGMKAELSTYAPTGEILSSAIDYNIDTEKTFVIGELGTEPLQTGTTGNFQWTKEDPDVETLVFHGVGVPMGQGDSLIHDRLDHDGVQATSLHYRIQLTSTGTNTPRVRKAGLGGIYSKKPRYDHIVSVRAYDRMDLNNKAPHPDSGPGLAKNIQRQFEKLRDSQRIVDFQEPGGSTEPFNAVKVQVRAIQVKKQLDARSGFTNIIQVQLTEVPD